MAVQTRLIYKFDDFQIDADERRLTQRGGVIPLQGKAFDVLLTLVRSSGRVLTKDEILGLVWPDQVVEESNLTVHMSAVRRALGERAGSPRYVVTVSGRGYKFIGDVQQCVDELPAAAPVHRVTSRPRWLFAACAIAVAIGSMGIWVKGLLRASAVSVPWTSVSVRRFPTHGGVPFRAVIAPDGRSMVYRQRINGRESLWLGHIDSNSSVKIGEQPGLSMSSLALSPNGANIFVTVRERVRSAGRLMRMPIVGGVMSEVLTDIDSEVSFSPDGRQMAFLRHDDETGNASIVTADVDGKNVRTVLVAQSATSIATNGVSWSPDGKTIAFSGRDGRSRGDQLLAVSVSDASVRPLANREWGRIGHVAWLPDGRGLVFTAYENTITRRCHVWYLSYPDGEVRRLTNDLDMYLPDVISVTASGTVAVLVGHNTYEIWIAPDGDVTRAHLALQGVEPRYEGVDGLAWTPDGSVLYSAYVADGEALWKIHANGGDLQQLTTNGANLADREISATADGRFVIFQSNRSGSFEVWRANADGTNLKRLTADGGSEASISPDGRWIVYTSSRAGKATLWRMPIDGGPPTQLTDRPSAWPDVSPDGKYVAYLESFNTSRGRLVIMPAAGGEPARTFQIPATVLNPGRLHWTPDGKAVMYRDSVQGLWRQSLADDMPRPVKGFEAMAVSQFAWSRDGRNLAYTRGAIMRDIVLLDPSKTPRPQ